MLVAIYIPIPTPNMKLNGDPAFISGFKTEKCAWDYVYSKMCSGCQEELDAALTGKKRLDSCELSLYHPSCAQEWEVVPEADLTIAELNKFKNPLQDKQNQLLLQSHYRKNHLS